MHLNFADEIVKGWTTGKPIKALCGYERIVVEGKPATGELCEACRNAAVAVDKPIPTRVLSPAEMRKEAHTQTWSYTYLGNWPSSSDSA